MSRGARPDAPAAASGSAAERAADDADDGGGTLGGLGRPAMVGVAVVTLSYLSVIYHVTDVVGGTQTLAVLAVTTLLAATALARFARAWVGVAVGVVLLGGGLLWYVFAVPEPQRELFTASRVVADTVELLTGLSVLRLTAARTWALAVAPGPLFVSWYLAVRGRYVGSVTVGGAALLFFVLTGDAGSVATLAGVIGVALTLGLETLDAGGGVAAQWDTLTLVIALMVVGASTISVVPGGSGGASPIGGDRPTTEASLISSSDSIEMVGDIRLSPKVRFTVESETGRSAYWHTGSYNRYTGDGWVRSGQTQPYRGELSEPPGETQPLLQRVTAKTEMSALPAAWKPVDLGGRVTRTTQVTSAGGIRTTSALRPGSSYAVRSAVPEYTADQLRDAGDDYPASVRERYLQLPASTPPRLERRATQIRREAGAENAYETAKTFERHLERTKLYSLDVEKPNSDIATSFLFEMQAGYCTYFATTMVAMLRTQGIPARFVTGYTPGERVSEEEWVVRGLNAHAWVQVYFPEVGWVQFDPTPSEPRQVAETDRLQQARANNATGVDAAGSETAGEWTPEQTTPSPDETAGPADGGRLGPDAGGPNATPNDTATAGDANATAGAGAGAGAGADGAAAGGNDGGDGAGGFELPSPSRETLLVVAAAVAALAAGARRFGLGARTRAAIRLYHQGRGADPASDAERAFERLERLLGRQYRSRRPGETPRAYLAALGAGNGTSAGLDERAATVGRIYERARYGGGVSREEADAAIEAVDSLAYESLPVVGRLRGR